MDYKLVFDAQEQQIISGFLSLVAEKPYDKITVKELTMRCGIARTTFYRSFEDTYDLLERIERYLLDELVLYRTNDRIFVDSKHPKDDVPVGAPYRGIEHWLATGVSLRFLLKAIMGEHGDLYFKERLIRRLKTELNQMMDDEHVPNDAVRPYYVAAIAAAYIGLLNHIALVEDDELISISAIAEIANSMRVAYFRTGENPPPISDEQLFGTGDEL